MDKTIFFELIDDFASLFFPRICVNCRKSLVYQEEILCTHCRWTLPETNYHLNPINPLFQKFVYEPNVKFAASFLYYNRKGVAQKLIHSLKYKNTPQVGVALGKWYGHQLKSIDLKADLIIPVPIHRKKELSRGYNQSQKIAEGLSEKLNIPVDSNSVIRHVETKTQTKKGKVDRWVNVDSIYKVKRPDELFGKTAIVVDDVITTGATMGMLLDVLIKAGVTDIAIVAIASGK